MATDQIRSGKYKKEVGLFGVVFLGTSAILGSAILFIPVTVLAYAGPAGTVAWIIGGVMMLVIGLIYAELGTLMPKTGGVASYPHISNGSLAGILNGWGAFLGYILAPVSETVAIVEYMSYFFPSLFNFKTATMTFEGELLTLFIVFLFFIGNYFGVAYLNQSNSFLTWLKLLSLAFIGVFFLAFYFHPSNFSIFPGGFNPYGSAGLLFAVATTVYAYAGFRQPIDYAEELKNYKRDIPIAIALSIFVSFVIYESLSVAFVGSINWHYFHLHPGDWQGLSALTFPLPALGFEVGLAVMAYFIFITSIHSSASSSLIYSGGAARVMAALAENKYLPPIFGRLSRRGIPYVAVIVVLIVSAIYTFMIPVFISIALVFVDASLVSYGPAGVSLIVFRKHVKAQGGEPYRLPFASILCPAGFLIGGLLIYWTGWNIVQIAIPSVMIGLLLFFYHARKVKIDSGELKGGLWLFFYFIAVMVLSATGSSDFHGNNIIQFPYDLAVFSVVSLAFYAWAVISGQRYMSTHPYSVSEMSRIT